jgi:pantoate--beta-alanine ligase
MDVVRRIRSMKEIARQAKAAGRTVGFVPTMGYLHEGHLSLVRRVRQASDLLVVSNFVNPTQFGANEDLDRYPRDLARDADLCIREGVDVMFAPEVAEMYPTGACTWVEVEGLSTRLEGASRPGHFRGVATVVLKLFEIVRPDVAAFGQKDAQQAILLQTMARDLMLDVEILVLPTVRDEDGVALSSRNVHLSPEERRAARAIPRALAVAEERIAAGERDAEKVESAVRAVLEAEPVLRVDYVAAVDTRKLQPISVIEGEVLVAIAVFAGRTRLIDNAIVRL